MSFSNSLLLRRFEDLSVPTESPKVPDSRGSIVVAESDPSELEHIASILRNLNFSVLTAGDGETALRLVREERPVMVLSSLELAKVDGYKLCQVLRNGKETEAIPFMFIVNQGEFPDHLIGHESYAHDYIQKPISVSEFQTRIQSLLNLVAPQAPARSWNEVAGDPAGERQSQTESERLSQLGKRLKGLLEEVVWCLDQLEGLLAPQEIPQQDRGSSETTPPAELERVNTACEATQGETEESEVEQYLPEYRRRAELGDSQVGDDVNDGVEDVFSEFFQMEKLSRGEAKELAHTEEKIEKADEGDDQLATLRASPGASSDENERANQLYEEARAYVLESLHGVVVGNSFDIHRAADVTESLVDCLGKDTSLVLVATDRQQCYAVSRHAVNVAIFSTRIAQTLGGDLQCQREVCLGGLLHELGVGKLPANLVHCVDSLSAGELKLLRCRQLQSGKLIKDLGPEYVWLGEVVSQITERENGTGYPMGLGGEEISEKAQIIGIADVFDACIHGRPYRESVSGYQALFELTTDQQRAFSDKMVKALIRSFSLYPFNECVRLSTGEIGKVVDINPENLSRPVVTILFEKEGKPLINPKTVDLGRESTIYIAEALADECCP